MNNMPGTRAYDREVMKVDASQYGKLSKLLMENKYIDGIQREIDMTQLKSRKLHQLRDNIHERGEFCETMYGREMLRRIGQILKSRRNK